MSEVEELKATLERERMEREQERRVYARAAEMAREARNDERDNAARHQEQLIRVAFGAGPAYLSALLPVVHRALDVLADVLEAYLANSREEDGTNDEPDSGSAVVSAWKEQGGVWFRRTATWSVEIHELGVSVYRPIVVGPGAPPMANLAGMVARLGHWSTRAEAMERVDECLTSLGYRLEK